MQQEKRIKERYVYEAIDKVKQWRNYFEMGVQRPNGTYYKPTLQEAADMVGIPKKTLEDYRLVLKQVTGIINLNDNDVRNQKMGFLRKIVKEQSLRNKNQTNKIISDEIEQIQTQNSFQSQPQASPQDRLLYNEDVEMYFQSNQESRCYQDMIIEGDFEQNQFNEENQEQQHYFEEPSRFQSLFFQDQTYWPTLIIDDSEKALREIQNSHSIENERQDFMCHRRSRRHCKFQCPPKSFLDDNQQSLPLCTF